MNFRTRSLLLSIVTLCMAFTAKADGIADALNGENKIWVVVLVLATIFAGIILFLVYLDRRIARLERDFKGSEQPSRDGKALEPQL